MEVRFIPFALGNKAINSLNEFGQSVNNSSLETSLKDLICFRVSQINGCAFCLDMHSKDLRSKGETEQRLYVLDAWREAPFYTEKEKAALAWAEALTVIKSGLVPKDIYDDAKQHFSETELVDLTMAVIAINAYNRINIAFGSHVGTYKVNEHK